jgi:hypothetical protein
VEEEEEGEGEEMAEATTMDTKGQSKRFVKKDRGPPKKISEENKSHTSLDFTLKDNIPHFF